MDLTTPPPSPGRRSQVKISSQPRSSKWYLDWQLEHCERETSTGGLLQNCDLPPPLKVFSVKGYDAKRGIGGISPAIPVQKQAAPTPAPIKDDQMDNELGSKHGGSENSSVLRALQLSQTRAREAEKAALLANKQNKELAVLILEESSRLYAHRQWVKLLEIEVSMLKKRSSMNLKEEVMDEDDAEPADSWFLALALCLGIASMGFVLSRCMF
ncbi:uncharacterized protein LOC103717970 [Phoenix dactylifera]|uniref:Uncharacterized protein LOC103717970 n=1 Tax=Phoenix dactylifera TaxID=42345 RepID=A0A8B7CRD8_PHODC|nr:uncharacterized protein LOC103717970 [Phoenix dactylifera]